MSNNPHDPLARLADRLTTDRTFSATVAAVAFAISGALLFSLFAPAVFSLILALLTLAAGLWTCIQREPR